MGKIIYIIIIICLVLFNLFIFAGANYIYEELEECNQDYFDLHNLTKDYIADYKKFVKMRYSSE